MKTAIFATIAVVILVAFSCSNEGGGFLSRIMKGSGGAVPVTVESVSAEDRSQSLTIPVNIEAPEGTPITLPEDAISEKVFVTEGETVTAGTTLLKLSEQELTTRLAKKRAELKEAQTNLDKNTYFLKNRDRLFEEGRIDKTQYDNLATEIAANEAQIEKLQADITRQEERGVSSTIVSPTSGTVSKIYAAPGLTIQAGKPLVVISKADPMTATFKLPSYNAASVKPQMPIKFKFADLGGEEILGKITIVGTELDPTDNTFIVKASVPNAQSKLKAGMRATIEFASPDKQRTFLIPEEALIKENRAYFVFTVSKGVAHKVQVIPNETINNRVEISRGLGEDDIVVVKGHDKLTEGTVVDIWGK